MFQCSVKLCGHLSLDRIAEGQYITRQQWIKWDAESAGIQSDVGTKAQPPSSSANDIDTDSASDTDTELYDLESLLEGQSGGSRATSDNELPDLPTDMDVLRAELTPVSGLANPLASPQHVSVPDNYSPATIIYLPTSPDYSPSQSPMNIDSESEHGFTPDYNSDLPITTRASDKFDLQNTDSDQELDGEAELINLVGAYINIGKLPRKIHGIYLFPQLYNLHDLTWNEYPFEPCSDHCVMPSRTDKSIARFYLAHSLYMKQVITNKHGSLVVS